MSAAPKPDPDDPHALAHTAFRNTGQDRLKTALDALLADGPVSEVRLLTVLDQQGAIDHREAGHAWMKDHLWKQNAYVKKHPGMEPVDSQAAFDRGVGRPPHETQAHRYDHGKRLLLVDEILGVGVKYWPVTATGQDYGDRRGTRKGLVYWRLTTPEEQALKREKHRWPKTPRAPKLPKVTKVPKTPRAKREPKGPALTPVTPAAPTDPSLDDEIDAITARIRELESAPLEQGKLLRRVRDEQLYLGLDFSDFEAYVEGSFAFSRQRAYQLIDADRVVGMLAPVSTMVDTGAATLPQNERQARMLVPLLDRPDDLHRAWRTAESTAEPPARKGDPPKITAAHIKDVMQRLGLAPEAQARPPATPDLDTFLVALEAGAYDTHWPRLRDAFLARDHALRLLGPGAVPCSQENTTATTTPQESP